MYQNIKMLREVAGISQEFLANTLGLSQSTIAMWETGKNSPRANLLPKIAELLHCTVDDLLREDYNISTVPKNGLLEKS